MTSIPANVQKYFAGSRTEQPKVQAADSKQDFSKVLDKQKPSSPKDNGVKTTQQKPVSETGSAPKQEQASGQVETKVSEQPEDGQMQAEETALQQGQTVEKSEGADQSQAGQPATDVPEEMPAEDLEQVMEVLQSAILQIQQLLQQQLDIAPEDLQQLMQEKGITELDLLQPEIVNQLVLDVAGAEDNLELVMDENLYQSQQTISREFKEISQKLKQDLARDDEELPQMLERLENSVSGMEVQRPEATAENPQQSDTRDRRGAEQDKGQDRNVTGQVFYQNYTAQAQNQTTGQQISVMASAGESAYVEAQESRQIMNQVLDYMKVSMKPENTVLDMHLHPESLGTLHIQISAREGVMTAHFTASSEAVKIVLENQMAVLKENFLQQDIKVEAIEVTVQTHQFEDNLEQGRQRGEEEAGKRPKRRRLDIGSLESGEELTESEQIITEMMAADGNTVDYLV
ncbi:MAG: flagellar hook-length control protein FliK, partial [Acetatifactor sp.]|nr:flagellar hook-length control protein FliK [Acetatifactor sp.]